MESCSSYKNYLAIDYESPATFSCRLDINTDTQTGPEVTQIKFSGQILNVYSVKNQQKQSLHTVMMAGDYRQGASPSIKRPVGLAQFCLVVDIKKIIIISTFN